jgi:hypothetical protein
MLHRTCAGNRAVAALRVTGKHSLLETPSPFLNARKKPIFRLIDPKKLLLKAPSSHQLMENIVTVRCKSACSVQDRALPILVDHHSAIRLEVFFAEKKPHT